MCDPGRLVAAWADKHDFAGKNRGFTLGNLSLRHRLRGAKTLGYHINTFNQHLSSSRHRPDNLAFVALVTQLPADRPKNTRPSWVAIVVNKNGSVLVETYQTTVGPTNFSLRPHDNTLDDRALDDCCVWSRLLHSNHALVANMPHLVLVVCEDRDDSDFFRARVVGNDHMTVGSKHSAPPRQSFPPWLRPQQASSAWSWKSDG